MVDVARGSQIGVSYAMEDSWASLPTVHNAYNLRVTGIGVNLQKDSFQSNELRRDRQISDLRHGMFSVSGDIPVELSAGAFDDLIESAMFNEWETDDTIVIGQTMKSFTLQKAFTDINQWHAFSGCVVNSWNLSVQPNAIITGTFNVIGETMETSGSASFLSTPSDKATNSPFDSFSGYLKEGGSTIAIITGIDFSLDNGITPLQVVGLNKAAGLVDGRATITGTVTAFFANSTLINKFINETESSMEFQLSDAALTPNTLTFSFPRIKYSGGDLTVNGEGPITMSMPFTALIDNATQTTLKITRSS
jgi:hypothetical protein